jgi:hypothetical protein
LFAFGEIGVIGVSGEFGVGFTLLYVIILNLFYANVVTLLFCFLCVGPILSFKFFIPFNVFYFELDSLFETLLLFYIYFRASYAKSYLLDSGNIVGCFKLSAIILL